MKSKLKTIALFTLLTLSTSSYSLGNSGWTTVTEIYQGQGNQPIIKLENMGNAVTTCASAGYLRFRDASSDVGKRHFSTLLAALSSGKEVNIKTTECSSNYAYIQDIQIRY